MGGAVSPIIERQKMQKAKLYELGEKLCFAGLNLIIAGSLIVCALAYFDVLTK
jgi:hypothetical protein